jgi:phosphatidylserine decarboxylase
MVRDGIYFAMGMAVTAGLLAWLATPAWSSVPLLLAVFFLWFFRDPERAIPTLEGAIVSPADGRVTSISTVEMEGAPRTRISIFLSVFDVHVNRSPIAGVIRDVRYRKGRFRNAMRADCGDENEQNIVRVENEDQVVIFKQIAGLLARRIVFHKRVGDAVARGERVGMIKFGSRVDVFLDPGAVVRVRVGEHVAGGESILAMAPVKAKKGPAPPSGTTIGVPPEAAPALRGGESL